MTEQEIIKKFDRKEALNELKEEVSIRGSLSPFAKKMFEYLEEDLKEYYKLKDKPKPTEQEILKKFFKIGFSTHYSEDNKYLLDLINLDEMSVIKIDMKNKRYIKVDSVYYSNFVPITLQEHQLLTELFKCYKWIE